MNNVECMYKDDLNLTVRIRIVCCKFISFILIYLLEFFL